MQSRPRPLAVPAFVVPVLVVAGLSLSGCAAGLPDGGVEAGIEQAIGGQPGDRGQPGDGGQTDNEGQADDQVGADIDGAGGADIPADWPSRVPLPPGEVIAAAPLESAMALTYLIPDLATAEAHVDSIRNAGFTVKSSEIHGDNQLWRFSDGELQILYHFLLSDLGDGSVAAEILVGEESE